MVMLERYIGLLDNTVMSSQKTVSFLPHLNPPGTHTPAAVLPLASYVTFLALSSLNVKLKGLNLKLCSISDILLFSNYAFFFVQLCIGISHYFYLPCGTKIILFCNYTDLYLLIVHYFLD